MSPKPTVILTHGSWHSPEHFAPLEAALRSHGYKTNSVWLPSMHYARLDPPLNPAKVNLLDDTQAIRTAIIEELSNSPATDVVVLSHSYGTIPASAALENLDKATRAKEGHANGVSSLLIISGLIVPAGMTFLDWAGGQIPPTVAVSTIADPDDEAKEVQVSRTIPDPGPVALFYHDVADEGEAKRYAALCTHQIWAVNTTVIPFAGWKLPRLEVSYLVCEEDRALPPGFQRVMIENANRERAAKEGRSEGDNVKEGSDSAAGNGGDALKKFQNDSLAGIEASKAILNGVRAGKAGEGPGNGHGEGSAGADRGGVADAESSAIKVTSIKSSHSPFLSRVEETAQWVRRSCGEEI